MGEGFVHHNAAAPRDDMDDTEAELRDPDVSLPNATPDDIVVVVVLISDAHTGNEEVGCIAWRSFNGLPVQFRHFVT